MIKYQGNKRQYASIILTLIEHYGSKNAPFWDLCCGSGSISYYYPHENYMVDSGPWGLFWQYMKQLQLKKKTSLPDEKILGHENYDSSVRSWRHQPVPADPYSFCIVFFALQAATFQGKAVNIHAGKLWEFPGFDRYISYKKFKENWSYVVATKIKEVFHKDIADIQIDGEANVYLDPDYKDTTGYGDRKANVVQFAERHPHVNLFVSHHKPIDGIQWDVVQDITDPEHAYRREMRGCSTDATELLLIRKKK